MGAAAHLSGQTLRGTRRSPITGTSTDWTVHDRLTGNDEMLTPGQFSIGYLVKGSDGREAFMKASDLDLVTGDGDVVSKILGAAQAYKFERDILDYCQGNNMDRVVTAIDYGEARVTFDDSPDVLFYLIFELAKGDIRNQVRLDQKGRSALDRERSSSSSYSCTAVARRRSVSQRHQASELLAVR